jgi:hypothetical protein
MNFRWLVLGVFLFGCGAQKTPDPQHTPESPVISIPQVVDAGAGNDSPATSKLPDSK